MSRSNNLRAIKSGVTFRPLSETVLATKKWWYSDSVSKERRNNILTNERSLMNREKEILVNWKAYFQKK